MKLTSITFYVLLLTKSLLSIMTPHANQTAFFDFPLHSEYMEEHPNIDTASMTPEAYFTFLDEEARRNFPVDSKVECREDDARFFEAYRTLKKLQKERRQLLWSLLKHPITSPSGLIGLGIIGLAALRMIGATVAALGEVVNAVGACYVIKKKINALQERMDRCTRVIQRYRQTYGDTAADILSADVQRGAESGD